MPRGAVLLLCLIPFGAAACTPCKYWIPAPHGRICIKKDKDPRTTDEWKDPHAPKRCAIDKDCGTARKCVDEQCVEQ